MPPITVALHTRLESRFGNVDYIFYNKFIQQTCFECQYSSDKKKKKEGEERGEEKKKEEEEEEKVEEEERALDRKTGSTENITNH